ncbi:dipeptidase PepE [Paraferrimonas sedimenticola]|uniref:Peptidase E n=1 Tax=Paraferrimonas sedimenticola TaxID=375674 RepID=A0AA37W190_9GAMM|nr:dipeptidase PepE [Paraferrimonas sedimenticola]GLP96658.1 peptidase E [Paraferrimonas sedimenticola]
MAFNALMLSASRVDDTPYLAHALSFIEPLTQASPGEWLFVPYAGVSFSFDDYLDKVNQALSPIGVSLKGVHQCDNPAESIANAAGIMVGGGNTFALLSRLYQNDLLEPLKARLAEGMPYIGWSAGSNITGASIRTTNDMPIVEPPSFNALALLPFQLNPHYTDYQPPGHNGETRAERLLEFCCLNPDTPVVGIQEGSALRLQDKTLTLLGDKPGYLFHGEKQKVTIPAGSDLSELL